MEGGTMDVYFMKIYHNNKTIFKCLRLPGNWDPQEVIQFQQGWVQ